MRLEAGVLRRACPDRAARSEADAAAIADLDAALAHEAP